MADPCGMLVFLTGCLPAGDQTPEYPPRGVIAVGRAR